MPFDVGGKDARPEPDAAAQKRELDAIERDLVIQAGRMERRRSAAVRRLREIVEGEAAKRLRRTLAGGGDRYD